MKSVLFKALLAGAIFSITMSPKSEDIDLFLSTSATNNGLPNVLLMVDNTGNWSSPFEVEMTALASLFRGLDVNKVNVGIMMFSETGGSGVRGNNQTGGGYIRAAVRKMDAPTKEIYAQLIDSFDKISDRSNSGKGATTMMEGYHYFHGNDPHAGNEKAKTDYNGNTENNSGTTARSAAVYAISGNGLNGNAIPSKGGSPYNSPIISGSCAKNFIVWIGNGAVQDPSNESNFLKGELVTAGGDDTVISISPSGSQSNWADEWARWAKADPDTEITTYTIDINKVTNGQGPGFTALLQSMAKVSGGKYFDVPDPNDLDDALDIVFSEILSVNSVFASVALPASTTAQSTFLNRVYIGFFRPDGDGFPRWPGNMKQYKLGLNVSGDLQLQDADGQGAINGNTGFITECARSQWTPDKDNPDGYWSAPLEPRGECTIGGVKYETHNGPDGPIVEKGAAAYVLRSSTTRPVQTCSSTFANCQIAAHQVPFNTTNVSAAELGVAAADHAATISWALGIDTEDEDIDGNNSTEMRPSVHGDVIHSRPVAINYGDNTDREIVVFYSGNDGILRAINANRTDATGIAAGGTDGDIGSIAPGQEMWAFMPPEFYTQIARNKLNTVTVKTPASGSNAGSSGLAKPYGIDGPLTAFEGTIGGVADKKILYAGTRRAGRVLYSFDVTNPAAPTLRWKKGCPNLIGDAGCSTADWADIGQTWSPPNITFAEGYGAGATPMIIMGGGYDNCDDDDNDTTGAAGRNHNCAATSKGQAVYLLDADTGAILQKFNAPDRAVVGSVTIVPKSENNPEIRYAYATDMGGTIYRIHGGTLAAPLPIGNTLPGSWLMQPIAKLGCDTAAGACTNKRKFLFGPDVIDLGSSLGVFAGTGDREKPIRQYGASNDVDNYFFNVLDSPTVSTWLSDENATCGADIICLDSLTPVDPNDGAGVGVSLGLKGWRMALAAGEQVVTSALTVANEINFSTHIPADPNEASCDNNLGTATAFNVNYINGVGKTIPLTGGGLAPSPVAGKVELDDGTTTEFCIGCGGEGSSLGGSTPGGTTTWTQPKARVYWNIEE
ncbi:MAG: hypothetical protein V7696_15670 [Halioglobus sp.]